MSDAVGLERISRILGYKITKGNFAESSPNLPHRIVLLGEANTANQADLDTDPKEITSAQQAGLLYGFGSPIHMACRILLPRSGSGIGGIPLYVHAQEAAPGATAKEIEVTPSGVATGNGTHYLKIAGRTGMDGDVYAINIEEGDTTADIVEKMSDAANAVLGCPMIGSEDSYVATFTSKAKSKSINDLNIEIDTGDDDLGITYAINNTASGAGVPSIADGLDAIGNDWATIVINTYGTETTIMDALEEFNGIPSANPTGRYAGTIMKPFVAITGSIADNPSTITDAREDDVTIAIAPAPLSKGLPLEAAANMTVLWAPCAQNTPHLDISGQAYPDMPTPTSIGSMAEYNNRDSYVKKGCSTVDLKAGRYYVQDFTTTYHPEGENPPQFRYVRNLNIDWNVRYGYLLLEQTHVVDKAIAKDTDVVKVQGVIKPKQWKQVLARYFEDLVGRALIADAAFSLTSLVVSLSTSNPDRIETFFRYKRSGTARVLSTTAEAGFNFGNLG